MRVSGMVLETERGLVAPDTVTMYNLTRCGSALNGVMTNMTWVRLPSGLWVMNFNGTTGYVTVPANACLNMIPALSLEAWVLATTPANNRQFLAKYYQATPAGLLDWSLDTQGGLWRATSANATGAVSSLAAITASVWYHLVLTYTTALLTLYVNGVSQGTDATPGVINGGNFPLWVGLYNVSYFAGQMSGIRVYNYALSAGQVLNRFEAERHWYGV